MASLLLGRRPATARGRDLVRWGGLFGIAPGTCRVALHRMTAAGELHKFADRYELVGGLARRQEEQQASLAPKLRRWSGQWRMAVAVGDARSATVRAEMRTTLRRARLAEWREGVWIRPDNLALVEDPRAAWLVVRPDDDAVTLAATLFDPQRWNEGATELVTRLAAMTEELRRNPITSIADAFVAGAASLRHIRADPLLPPALLPPRWAGDSLRETYVAYERDFTVVARDWFRAQ